MQNWPTTPQTSSMWAKRCAAVATNCAGDWLDLARDLRATGKTVVLSGRTLIETGAEALALKKLCAQEDFMIEVGVKSAPCGIWAGGPLWRGRVNAYHGGTLQWLAEAGRNTLCGAAGNGWQYARLLEERPAGLAAKVLVWGRMALAFSARCFTARHFRLKKDECGFRCRTPRWARHADTRIQ